MSLSVHSLGQVLAQEAKRIAEDLILDHLNASDALRPRAQAGTDLIALLTPPRVARGLTPRERELRDLLLHGISLPTAATRMGIAPATARSFLARIKQKLPARPL
jgi:DNA-binding CsgD family transcriptional regulator